MKDPDPGVLLFINKTSLNVKILPRINTKLTVKDKYGIGFKQKITLLLFPLSMPNRQVKKAYPPGSGSAALKRGLFKFNILQGDNLKKVTVANIRFPDLRKIALGSATLFYLGFAPAPEHRLIN